MLILIERVVAVAVAMLTFSSDVSVTEPAVRGPAIQMTEVPDLPEPTGVHGLPFAPSGLSDCDEMMFYATQFGLPSRFEGIGWRESNCRNEDAVRTFCCHGYFQMFASQHLADHRMRPRYHQCGVFSAQDFNSDTPIEKQRQACTAGALYDLVGDSPWAATR